MKISLSGRYTIEEFEDAFRNVLKTFQQHGIDEVQSANLYLTLHQKRRPVELIDERGEQIQHLKFDEPHVRPFRRASANLKIVPPSKLPFKPSKPESDPS